MFEPEGSPRTQIVVGIKAEAKFSRSTIANLNATAEQLTATKKSMLDDMSKGNFETPQQALDAIMRLQSIQNQVSDLKNSIADKSVQGFTAKDVETIGEMKRQGMSEEKIAELFDTNQTKINRLRNGKALLDEV